MNPTSPFYIRILSQELERRKRVNAQYSLRSFANHLGLDSSVLSAVLKQKRLLPLGKVTHICQRLRLDKKSEQYFVESLKLSKPVAKKRALPNRTQISLPNDEYQLIEEGERTKKILSEWEYFALFSLMDTTEYQSNPRWVAKRLGITYERAQELFQTLSSVGLIRELSSGAFEKVNQNIKTTDGIPSEVLRQSHKEGLIKALEKIDTVPLTERSYSSMTVAFHPKNLELARSLIREFRRQFTALIEADHNTEVYHLAIQFFPLTQIENLTSKHSSQLEETL